MMSSHTRSSRQQRHLLSSSRRSFVVSHSLFATNFIASYSSRTQLPQRHRLPSASHRRFVASHLLVPNTHLPHPPHVVASSYQHPPHAKASTPHACLTPTDSSPHVACLSSHASASSYHTSSRQHQSSDPPHVATSSPHILLTSQLHRLTPFLRHSFVVPHPPPSSNFVVSHLPHVTASSSRACSFFVSRPPCRETRIVSPALMPALLSSHVSLRSRATIHRLTSLLTLQFRPLTPSARCSIIVSHPPSRCGFVVSTSVSCPSRAAIHRQLVVSHLLLAPCRSSTSNMCPHTHTQRERERERERDKVSFVTERFWS
jgi:hypothetical protein